MLELDKRLIQISLYNPDSIVLPRKGAKRDPSNGRPTMKMNKISDNRRLAAIYNLVFLALLVCMLFPVSSLIESSSAEGTRTTVADDGTGLFYNIQDAIDSVSPGDQISIKPGTYNEQVIINKRINLIASSDGVKIIPDSDGPAVIINSNNSHVQGLEISGSGDGDVSRGIEINTHSCSVTDTVIGDCDEGINIAYVTGCVLLNVTATAEKGIVIDNCEEVVIINSQISDCADNGIIIFNSDGIDIINTSIEDCNNDQGVKILSSSSACEITDCYFTDNDNYAIHIDDTSNSNTITSNTFSGNNQDMTQCYDASGSNSWDDGSRGNLWMDHLSPDSNSNGIVDTPYLIDGGASAQDNYPLTDLDQKDQSQNQLINNTSDGTGPGNQPTPRNPPSQSNYVLFAAFGIPALLCVSLITFAFLIWWYEPLRYWFFSMLTPLYSRIKKDNVFNNEIRGMVYGAIKSNPGISYSELINLLELNNGTLSHHIKILLQLDMIKTDKRARHKLFFDKEFTDISKVMKLKGIQKVIYSHIQKNPGQSQTKIANHLDMSPQALGYHINILSKEGLIKREWDYKERLCYPGKGEIRDSS